MNLSTWNDGWFNGTPIPLTTNNVPSDGRIQFFVNNGITQWSQVDNPTHLKALYESCSPLAAIINLCAEAFTNAHIQAIKTTTENPVRGLDKEWQKLLDTPNWQQSQKQFFKQLYTYRKLAGWVYVKKVYPSGFRDRPSALWVLPPWTLQFRPKNLTAFFNLTEDNPRNEIIFSWAGYSEVLDPKDLIFIPDNTNTFNELTWLPHSRIMSMQQPITLLLSILEANNTLVNNKGALGIISNETQVNGTSVPWLPGQKEQVQEQYQRGYGLTRHKWQMPITEASLKYTPDAFDVNPRGIKVLYNQIQQDLRQGWGLTCPNKHG